MTLAAFGKVTFRPNFRVQAGATLAVRTGDYSESDGDDLPDVWEYKYFGNLNQGRNGDYDSDGSSNYLEYVFKTDPADDSEKPPFSTAYQDVQLGIAGDELAGGAGLVARSIRVTNENAMEHREDLAFPSPNSFGLAFRATYNSRATQAGILGYGWFHNFGASLNPSSQLGNRAFLRIIDGTGKGSYFIQEVSGYYSGVFGERGYVKAEGGGYGWYRLDGTRYVFTSAGKLSTVEDEKENVLALAYDGQGRLQTVTDNASGRVLTFNYSGSLLASISGPVTTAVADGIWVEYGYDGNQNLTTVTYADGSGITYVYSDANDLHNLTQKKDLLNHILREWAYNGSDQATVCRSPDGRGVELVTYQANQVQVKDVYDITRTYTLVTVDGLKRLSSMTGGVTNAPYAESNAVQWVYDDRGRLSEVEYGGGRIDLYQNYDERGNPGTVILAYGSAEERTIYYTYHPEMNVPLTRTEVSVLGGGNKVTIWDYDNDYDATANESPTRLLSRIVEQGYTKDINNTTQAYEYVTTFTYNAKGQVLSIDGPRSGDGDKTEFTYNATTGNLESVAQPHVGSTYFVGYDNAGRVGTITDVNNQAKGLTYDGRGRVTIITHYADDPDSSTQFAYVGGLLDSVTDPDGVVQYFDYDAQYGRLGTITDYDGNYISHTYETYPKGNLTERSKFTSGNSRTSRKRWSYEHPSYPGKLYREIQADDTYRQYGYDDAGNVSSMVDPNGNLMTYAYDFMDRIGEVAQWVNDPNLRDLVTGYGYDGQGNLITVTDANSHVTTYAYDDMGRVVSTTSTDTGTTRYAYDEAGNLRFKKDAKAVTVEYTYDNLNRVTLANYPGTADDIAYTYDQGTNGKGHLTTMVDPSGTITFGYDARGRLVQKASTIGGINYQPVIYFYTPGGKLGSVTYPSTRTLNHTRDDLGRIGTLSTTYNSITKDLANGLTYRPFGGPLGLTNGSGGVVSNQAGECDCVTVSNPGQPRERTYVYDYNRNLTSITGTTTPQYSQTFGYDELNRLISATGRYGSISYTYDDVGNRVARNINGVNESFSYFSGTNRLQTITGGSNPRTFTSDSNGNITGDGTLTFVYDQSNQLIEVEQGANTIAEYTFNGLGQRAKKVAGGVTTVYHYDLDGKLIAESLLNGTMTKEYLYMGKVRVAMVDVAGGGTVYAYHNDRLGTPELLTTKIGNDETVAWEAWYEPFGEGHIHPSSSVVNNIRLPGQYFDSETGLHNNWHRYYDPRTGRYVTPDPIGQAGGINLYPYVGNNPVNRIDPLGLVDLNLFGPVSCF
jgi:RHS repeat-associated protein